MAERKFVFRLTAEGVDELRQKLEALGPAGKAAMRQLVDAAPALADPLRTAERSVDDFRKKLEGLGRGGAGGGAVGGLAESFGGLEGRAKGAVRGLNDVRGAVELIGGSGSAAAKGLGLVASVVGNVSDAFGVLASVARANPIGLAVTAAGAAAAAFLAWRAATAEVTGATGELAKEIRAATAAGELFELAQRKSNEVLKTAAELAAQKAAEERKNAVATNQAAVAEARKALAVAESARAERQRILAMDPLGRPRPGGAPKGDRPTGLDEEVATFTQRLADAEAQLKKVLDPSQWATTKEAAEQFAKSLGSVIGQIDAVAGANARLKEQLAAIEEAWHRGLIGNAEKDRLAAEARAQAEEKITAEILRRNEAVIKAEAQQEKDREAASKRAQEIIAADAKRNRSVEEYIKGLETAAALEGLSTEEKKIQQAILEAQNKLIDEQGHKLRELTEEEKARIANAVRTTEAIKTQREAAEKAAKEFERAWEHTVERVTDFAADFLFDRMKGGSRDFWEDFKDLARRAFAQVAAQALIRVPLQFVGSALGLPVGGGTSAAGGAASNAAGSWLGNLIPNPISLASWANSGFSFATNPLAQLGGAVGGLFGAGASLAPSAATMALANTAVGAEFITGATALGAAPALSPLLATGIGAIIAIGAGLALSGILGGKKSVGPNAAAWLGYDNGQFTVGNRGADNNGDLAGAVSGTQAVADFLNRLQTSYGIAPAGTTPAGSFAPYVVPAGTAGPGVGIGIGAAAGHLPGSPDAVIAAMLAGGYLTAESEVIKQVLANSKAADSAALEADLAFGKLYEQLTTVVDPATELTKAMAELSKSFDEAFAKAGELGLSQTKLREGMRDQFDLDVERSIRAITDPLGLALEDFERGAALRVETARKLGADLVKVEELTALERERVVAQYASGLKSLFDELAFGGLSGLSPSASYDAVKAQLAASVASGNAAGIESYGRQFIGLSREMFASGAGFQADRDYLLGVLGSYLAPNDNALTNSLLADSNAIVQQQTSIFLRMADRLDSMEERLRRYHEALMARAA